MCIGLSGVVNQIAVITRCRCTRLHEKHLMSTYFNNIKCRNPAVIVTSCK